MVLRLLILTTSYLFFSTESLYDLNSKKAHKIFSKIWPEHEIKLSRVNHSTPLHGELYRIIIGHKPQISYALFDQAFGKVDNFTYMIIFTSEGAIQQVAVLQYKENYGGEIASKRFLKQFIGKSDGTAMDYPDHIDGISGATISVQSITHGIKRNSKEFLTYLNSHQ